MADKKKEAQEASKEEEVKKDQEVKGSAKEEKASEKKESKKKSSKKTKVDEVEELGHKLQEVNDKYLRLSAEFDNYRKRTLKEKMELTKTASADILINILSVVDDMERAMGAMEKAQDIEAVKEGVDLIYVKFKDFITTKGVKEIEALNQNFDTDLHEALTKIPAPSEELKGKVVDVIEKGYMLNDKVIRFSKVVVGE